MSLTTIKEHVSICCVEPCNRCSRKCVLQLL